MSGLIIVGQLLLHLWPLVLVPAVLLTAIRPGGRLAFFLLGLAFFFAADAFMDLGGPDSPGLVLPFFGLALSAAALIAEAAARLFRAARRRRARDSL